MPVYLFVGQCAFAQESESAKVPSERLLPKSFTNSVIYGIGAGTLVGVAASSNFKRNFAKNFDGANILRGASYGLYGGILLGLYLTFAVNAEPRPLSAPEQTFNSQPVNEEVNAKPSSLRLSNNFRPFHELTTFAFLRSSILPELIFLQSSVAGALVTWNYRFD